MTPQEEDRTVRVTNIQRFCLHDGPGIRTTVFLKGCTIHCPWCANPENIRYECQTWKDESGNAGFYGYDISLKDLYKEVLKDKIFYTDGGGITFSGGEPLLQIKEYIPLLKDLKKEGIHLAIETALFVDERLVEMAVPYFDFYYIDMKILEQKGCTEVIGGDVRQYEKNFRFVCENTDNYCVRIPCVHGYTDKPENEEKLVDFIIKYDIHQIEIFAAHTLAYPKYQSLGLSLPPEDDGEALKSMINILENNKITYSVIKI